MEFEKEQQHKMTATPQYETVFTEEYFLEKKIRASFVRKVYSILMLQMLITVGMISVVLFIDVVKQCVKDNVWLYMSAYIVFLITFCWVACCRDASRTYPCNWALLLVITFSLGYMVAVISAYHDTQIVLFAMVITCGICLLITIFSMQTRIDITSYGAYLFIFNVAVLLFGLVALVTCFTTHCHIMTLVYATLIAILFSFYLMYDTQMIMGGRKIELSPEEYIFGAIMLYVDIIQIFLSVLTLSGD